MEGSAGGAAGRRTRIRWSKDKERSLLELAEKADPHKRGFGARLSDLWLQQFPTLPATASALGQKLRSIKAKADNIGASAPAGTQPPCDASKLQL